jgi:alpha-ketoglutaric semialdehyde dehydrogenase
VHGDEPRGRGARGRGRIPGRVANPGRCTSARPGHRRGLGDRARHQRRSRTAIKQALDETDAESIYEGQIPSTSEFASGYFVAPKIFRGAAIDSNLAQRELFGPVLAEFVAEDLDHAIALANSTPYGLSASLYTRDLRAALKYIDRIEAGMVRVNGDTTGVDPHAPFGGMKASSSGSREQGPAAREFYTEIKTVQING